MKQGNDRYFLDKKIGEREVDLAMAEHPLDNQQRNTQVVNRLYQKKISNIQGLSDQERQLLEERETDIVPKDLDWSEAMKYVRRLPPGKEKDQGLAELKVRRALERLKISQHISRLEKIALDFHHDQERLEKACQLFLSEIEEGGWFLFYLKEVVDVLFARNQKSLRTISSLLTPLDKENKVKEWFNYVPEYGFKIEKIPFGIGVFFYDPRDLNLAYFDGDTSSYLEEKNKNRGEEVVRGFCRSYRDSSEPSLITAFDGDIETIHHEQIHA